MDKKLIKSLKDNPSFVEFQNYIVSEIDRLDSVEGLNDMKNEDAGEAAKIRVEAIAVLQSILQPFIDFNEKREPTKKEVDAAKSKVGL